MSSEPEFDSVMVWFRRDLRADDHAALMQATRRARRVHCAFVFDREILDALPDRRDRRVEFIHASVLELDALLRRAGGALHVRHAHAREAIPAACLTTGLGMGFTIIFLMKTLGAAGRGWYMGRGRYMGRLRPV